MADYHIASKRRHVIQLYDPGTLTAADDQDAAVIPFKYGKLVGVLVALKTLGDTGGDTSIMIERTRAGVEADMLSASIDIAITDADYFAAIGPEGINTDGTQEVQQGDIVNLNTDSIPTGTASTHAAVALIFQIIEE